MLHSRESLLAPAPIAGSRKTQNAHEGASQRMSDSHFADAEATQLMVRPTRGADLA